MFFGKIYRFLRGRNASIAPTFAIMVVPMVLVAGMATDVARHHSANRHVQQALDAAGLAAARQARLEPTISNANLTEIAQNYFDAQLKTDLHLAMKDIVISQLGADFTLEVEGELPTSFMRLAGHDTMELMNMSEVTASVRSVAEVALVLDMSRSMTGDRLTTLKKAATNFVDTVVDPSSDQVRVSIVPFGTYVNVGLSNRFKSWMYVTADMWGSEIECEPDRSVCPTQMVECWDDGVKKGCEVPNCAGITLREECNWKLVEWNWNGCVYSRKAPNDIRDGFYNSSPIRGFHEREDTSTICATEMVPLSNDVDALKLSIDNLVPRGETYIPAGLMWGFRTLTPEEPFDEGLDTDALAAINGRKVLVLMSDGENSLYRGVSGKHFKIGSDSAKERKATDRTEDACDLIKADGVEIFTIAFEIPAGSHAEQRVKDCASPGPDYFFAASDEYKLIDAFKEIANSFDRELAVSG